MTIAWRAALLLALASVLLPEFGRYRAEHALAAANVRLDRILRGIDRGDTGLRAAAEAEMLASSSAVALPGDPRVPLLTGVAQIVQGEGAAAAAGLEAAIAQGERPELTLNLGRARAVLGDMAGADAAYLRTAWASPIAIATLPAAMRADIQARVARLEAELREGRLHAPPPL